VKIELKWLLLAIIMLFVCNVSANNIILEIVCYDIGIIIILEICYDIEVVLLCFNRTYSFFSSLPRQIAKLCGLGWW